MTPETYISPNYRFSHWYELRPSLDNNANTDPWLQAVAVLRDRIENRFFEPINRLQAAPDSSDLGFGFAMVTLDCLLIDTIQSFREGRTKGSEARTAKAFDTFFRESDGFKQEFSSRDRRDEFFYAIRCGLMHDGETRKGWRIWKRHPDQILERVDDGYILYRDNFHEAIHNEFENFVHGLSTGNGALRENFLKRMDAICGLIPPNAAEIRYFAYGSNMSPKQMEGRAPSAVLSEGVAHLPGFRVIFNKRSRRDGTGKANIVASAAEGAEVQGALYRLSEQEFEGLKEIEKGYTVESVEVNHNSAKIWVQTFVADPASVYRASPSKDYLATILDGAQALALPYKYIADLRSSANEIQSTPN